MSRRFFEVHTGHHRLLVVCTPALCEGARMATDPDRDADTSLTLLERLQKNPEDPQAWNVFVERYRPRIRQWCLTWGLQDSDADDVAQDVLVKLFAVLRKFQYDPSRSFRAWLKTVTQHSWIDFAAARRKEPLQTSERIDTLADSAEAQSDLERQLEEAFEHELLEVAMPGSRNAPGRITGKHFTSPRSKATRVAEAAHKLGIAVGTVFVAKHRVQKMLQEEVQVLKNEPR